MEIPVQSFVKKITDDDGQALVEYALIIMLVALVCIAALTAIGTTVSGLLSAVAGAF